MFASRTLPVWKLPDPIKSPDGLLDASPYPSGVLLHAKWTGSGIDDIWWVRFVRRTGHRVRSGDPAVAVGGEAYAYDMEGPLVGNAAWYAEPIYKDGTVGDATEGVGLALTATRTAWIKSVNRPELSITVTPSSPFPGLTYGATQNLNHVLGSPYPAGSVDVHDARAGTLQFYTSRKTSRKQLLTLLDTGTLLFQATPEVDFDDMYFVAADLGVDPLEEGRPKNGWRLWSVPFTEVDRPGTADSPLVIPGRSYDSLDSQAPTYDDLDGLYSSYNSMVVPPK